MELTDRKKQILRAIVDSYIRTAEPVGSKTISQMPGMDFSPATIRNEMADLTSMGLLEQPHTSAGRVPSAAGYRLYVDELMQSYRLSMDETKTINQAMEVKMQEVDKMISQVGKLVSKMTNLPAYAVAAAQGAVSVKRFDLILAEANSFILVVMTSSNQVKNKLIQLPVQRFFSGYTPALQSGNFIPAILDLFVQLVLAFQDLFFGFNQRLFFLLFGNLASFFNDSLGFLFRTSDLRFCEFLPVLDAHQNTEESKDQSADHANDDSNISRQNLHLLFIQFLKFDRVKKGVPTQKAFFKQAADTGKNHNSVYISAIVCIYIKDIFLNLFRVLRAKELRKDAVTDSSEMSIFAPNKGFLYHLISIVNKNSPSVKSKSGVPAYNFRFFFGK